MYLTDEEKRKLIDARYLRSQARYEGSPEKYDRAGQLYQEIGYDTDAQICFTAASILRKVEA